MTADFPPRISDLRLLSSLAFALWSPRLAEINPCAAWTTPDSAVYDKNQTSADRHGCDQHSCAGGCSSPGHLNRTWRPALLPSWAALLGRRLRDDLGPRSQVPRPLGPWPLRPQRAPPPQP